MRGGRAIGPRLLVFASTVSATVLFLGVSEPFQWAALWSFWPIALPLILVLAAIVPVNPSRQAVKAPALLCFAAFVPLVFKPLCHFYWRWEFWSGRFIRLWPAIETPHRPSLTPRLSMMGALPAHRLWARYPLAGRWCNRTRREHQAAIGRVRLPRPTFLPFRA